MRNTLVIVGAGFSGTVLAANLLRRPPATPTDIVLAERGSAIGRGVAYASHEFPYLLNVPAARLSADSDDPLQFLRFARGRLAAADGEDFLPRALYGDYLQDLLRQAERAAPPHIRLVRLFDEVTGIELRDGAKPLAAQFTQRAPLAADFVVLALGVRAVAAAGVGRTRFASPRLPAGSTRFAEHSDERAFGCHRRQRLDHGGRRVDFEPRRRTYTEAAHDFPARIAAAAADGLSGRRDARWRRIAAGKRTFAQAVAQSGPGAGARGRSSRRRLARGCHLDTEIRAPPVAAAARRRATPLRAAPAGALGRTPAPSAAAIGRTPRATAAQRQIAGQRGPHPRA